MAKSAIFSLRILSDAQNAVQGINQTGSAMGGLMKGAGLLAGALAGAFAVDKIIDFGKKAVSAAGDLEQSSGAIDTVFKDGAGQMHKFADEAQSAVGLTKNQYNELGTLIGTQLKNGGTSMDELGGKTNDLVLLGADLSSMFGGTAADAVGALSSALKGERDPIERYGVSLNQAKIDAEAAALGFEKVGGSLSTEANQAATLSLIMKQTADAHGNFARESDTLQHQQQVAAATWGNLTASIGDIFLPVVTSAYKFLNDNILPVVGTLIDKVGSGGLAGAFGPLGGIIGSAFSTLGPAFSALLPLLIEIWQAFSPLSLIFGALLPVLPAVAGMLASLGETIATVLGSALTELQPLISTLITHLSGALVEILPVVAGLLSILGFAFTTLAPVITGVLGAVMPLITSLVGSLMPILTDLVKKVMPPVASIFGTIVLAIAPLITQIASLLIPIIEALLPVVVTVFKVVADVIGAAMQVVQGIIQVVTGLITGNWEGAFEGLKNITKGGIDLVMALVRGIPDLIRSALSGLGHLLLGLGEALMNGMFTGIMNGWYWVSDWFGGMPYEILNYLGSMGNLLWSAGKAILAGFLEGLYSKWRDVQQFVGGIATWIADHKGPLSYDKKLLQPAGAAILGGLLSSMQGEMPALQRFLGDVTDEIAAVGDVNPTVTIGSNSRLAALTARTGDSSGGGNTYNINFTVTETKNAKGTAKEIVKMLGEELRFTGKKVNGQGAW